jgi:predicted dehydrogenase
MAVNKTYKVLLIGCGGMGYQNDFGEPAKGRCSHFRAFHQSSRSKLVGVVDVNGEVLRQIEEKHNVATYSKLNQVPDSPDVVIVATPDESHYAVLMQALTLQPKIVLCEKPLARTSMQINEILKAYGDANVPLFLNYYRRYHPAYKALYALLQSKALGQLDSVTCYYSRGLLHNGIHYFDLFRWWFGDILDYTVTKVHTGLDRDDPTVSLCLSFRDRLVAYLLGLPTRKTVINEIDIIGEKGRVTIDTLGKMSRYQVDTHPDFAIYNAYRLVDESFIDIGQAGLELPCALFDYLDHGRMPATPAEDSLPLYEQINQIKGSLR